ncbi:MAG: extracellular solute-binding protein [Dehalococcoidia bacterium]|nr:extracellular solute-binding protein [Dehalococcoidia bacterium]
MNETPRNQPAVNRRAFLSVTAAGAGAALAAACAPAAAPAPVQAPAAAAPPAAAPAQDAKFKADWEALVAAAKKEGKVNVFFSGSGAFAKIGLDFEAAYPGIKAEVTAISTASLFLPKIAQEREAGLYNWDVVAVQAPFSLTKGTLRDLGTLEPVRPLLIHPDVVNDKAWPGGFDKSWVDNDKKWAFAFSWQLIGLLWINTDMVKEGEIKSVKDLTDPKWKGKIMSADPRNHGQGFIPATIIAGRYDNDILKKIWVDQEAALSRDTRQITEALVRGKYAMGFGVTPSDLQPFLDQGLGKNVKGLPIDSAAPLMRGIQYVSKAPNPNAAKLFLNWFLSKDGQTSWVNNALLNSRRNDVPVVDKLTWVDPAVNHPLLMDTEEMMNKPLETAEYFKKIIP